MHDPAQVSQLLKKAEQAIRANTAEIAALKAKVAADEPKLAELDQLQSWKGRLESCQKIAARMVETDQISVEDKDDKIAALMELEGDELKTIKEAVEIVATRGSVGQLDKEASTQGGNAFWETWNSQDS